MRADVMHTSTFSNTTPLGTAWRAAALAALLVLPGCTAQQKQGDSSAYLAIMSLTAAPGGGAATQSTVLASDVLTFGATYSDTADVSLQLGLKDPTTPVTPSSPSSSVTITRYRVNYVRLDGGVDVPAPFEGGATFTVAGSTLGTGTITLVRAQTKVLPPLVGLVGRVGTESFIPVRADVTFLGADQAGREVSVTGSISINFADWPDQVGMVAPAASFTVTLRADQTADFDASTSTVPPGRSIVSYAWNFGDGQTQDAGPLALASHRFPTVGPYTVTLTVKDSAGYSYTVSRTITLRP